MSTTIEENPSAHSVSAIVYPCRPTICYGLAIDAKATPSMAAARVIARTITTASH